MGTLTIFKASARRTGESFSLIEQLAPRGMAMPLHVQPEDEVSNYVLEGEMTFYLGDGEPIPASAGSFVHIPAGTSHAFQVDSETARFLNLSTPQHERFFRAGSPAARSRVLPPEEPLDMEKLGAAAQQFGVEIIGPPPGAQA